MSYTELQRTKNEFEKAFDYYIANEKNLSDNERFALYQNVRDYAQEIFNRLQSEISRRD